MLVIVGTMISAKSDNPFVSFLGYNLIVFPLGIVVSEAVVAYGGMDSAVVGQAFLYTAIITLYIGYDMYKAQVYPKTADNAVDCAVDIYMDIVLLFLQLLQIFGDRD